MSYHKGKRVALPAGLVDHEFCAEEQDMTPVVNRPMTLAEWGLLILLSFLWGGSFFFVGVAVKELPALTIVVARVGLAAIALAVVVRMTGTAMPRSPRIWWAFAVLGLLNNAVPFSLIAWGQHHVASGVASIFNAATPLFTVLVAHVATDDEKATPGRLFGVVIGLLGVTIMIGGAALATFGVEVLAQFAILAAALSYACAGVYGRRFRALHIAPLATTAGQVTASSVMLAPVMLVVDRPWTLPAPSLNVIAALVTLALVSTAFAYILYFRILATAGATNVLLVTFLVPVSAIVLGVTILGETLTPAHALGMALIGIGLAAVDGRPWRRLMASLARQRQPLT
jgi:drug/metabolite transporter (DMT)-like permease